MQVHRDDEAVELLDGRRRVLLGDPLVDQQQQRAPRPGALAHRLDQRVAPAVVAAELLDALLW
jgi:hypothetical protein